MDRYTLPPAIESLSTDSLKSRLDEIQVYTDVLKDTDQAFNIDSPADGDHPSGLDVIESLAAAKLAIDAVITQRETEATEAADRRAAALAALAPAPEPEVEETPEPETTELAAEEAPAETPVEEAPEVETLAAEDPAPVEEPAAEAEAAPVEAELAAEEPEVAEEPAPVVRKDPAQALSNMNAKRTASERPRATEESTRNGLMTVPYTDDTGGYRAGSVFGDIDELSVYMADRVSKRSTQQWKSDEPKYIPLMSSEIKFAEGDMLVEDSSEQNYGIVSKATADWEQAQEEHALTAAGSPCAPLMPTYEFTSCFDVQRPVDAGLARIGAPRGGIRFLNQVDISSLDGAITVKDAADSALLPGDAGYTDKNCDRITCPTETELTVAAISRCVTFDNLNMRVFPEQIRHMLQILDLAWAKRKDIELLNRIDTFAGTPVDIGAVHAATYGSVRGLLREMVTAAHQYRKRNNMNKDRMLDVWLPDAVEEILMVDAANDYNRGGADALMQTQDLVALIARKARLNVRFYYYDSSNAGFPASAHNGAANTFQQLPQTFRSYMAAPGSMVQLDGGSLDVGMVRDSTLNAQNEVQFFAEEWFELAKPGCEVISFTHVTCPSGTGPIGVAAEACP